MTCLSLTLYRDFGLLPPHVRSGLETVGVAALNVEAAEDEFTVNALIVCYV